MICDAATPQLVKLDYCVSPQRERTATVYCMKSIPHSTISTLLLAPVATPRYIANGGSVRPFNSG